jgi:hypothetical protein
MKKPAITGHFPIPPRDASAIKETLEIVTGKRPNMPKLDIAGLEALTVSNPPTQAQVEFLRGQLAILARRLDE